MPVRKLSEMKPGQKGAVDSFSAMSAALLRIQEQGVVEGVEVEFMRRAPLGDPLEIRFMNVHLTLRTAEAESIHVRLIH